LNMSGGSTVWSSTLIKIMSSLFTARSSQSGAVGPTWSLARGYPVIVANLWSARRRIAFAAAFSRVMKTSFSIPENQHLEATPATVRLGLGQLTRPRGQAMSAQVEPRY
jgi:hypothetical protein